MRSWLLMAVAGLVVVIGVSSNGSADWLSGLKQTVQGVSCYGSCTQMMVQKFWGASIPTPKQKSDLINCLQCRSGANKFTARLQEYMEKNLRSPKTAFVCGEVQKYQKYPYAKQVYEESCGGDQGLQAINSFHPQSVTDPSAPSGNSTSNTRTSHIVDYGTRPRPLPIQIKN